LLERDRLGRGPAAPAVGVRPRDAGPPAVGEGALPVAAPPDVLDLGVPGGVPGAVGPVARPGAAPGVGVEPRPRLLAEGGQAVPARAVECWTDAQTVVYGRSG